MDTLKSKIEKFQKILLAYIQDLAETRNNSLGNDMTFQAITDLHGNHFQLVRIGWQDHRFLYTVLIHLDINADSGNVWIQQNNTEIQLDEELGIRGIPKNNLVLGFRPESMRPFSGYAVA